jgi:hypothetical protein
MCLKTPGQVLLLVLDTFNSEVRHPIESAQALFVRLDRTFENDVLFLTVSGNSRTVRYFRVPCTCTAPRRSSLPCGVETREPLAMAIRHNNHSPGPTIKRGYTRHSHGTGYSATLVLLFQVPPPFPDPTRANRIPQTQSVHSPRHAMRQRTCARSTPDSRGERRRTAFKGRWCPSSRPSSAMSSAARPFRTDCSTVLEYHSSALQRSQRACNDRTSGGLPCDA